MNTEQEKQLAEMVIFTDELAEQLLEEKGLEVADLERFVRYVWLVQIYPPVKEWLEYYRDNLAKWVEDEEQSYYGQHENTAEFTRYYLDDCVEHKTPDWVVIDYEATWNENLRHDFTAEDNGRGVWVWADIY